MAKKNLKDSFLTVFSTWETSTQIAGGTLWVSLDDLHTHFTKSLHPELGLTFTKSRLGRALTPKFGKRLGGKPVQIGYLLSYNPLIQQQASVE